MNFYDLGCQFRLAAHRLNEQLDENEKTNDNTAVWRIADPECSRWLLVNSDNQNTAWSLGPPLINAITACGQFLKFLGVEYCGVLKNGWEKLDEQHKKNAIDNLEKIVLLKALVREDKIPQYVEKKIVSFFNDANNFQTMFCDPVKGFSFSDYNFAFTFLDALFLTAAFAKSDVRRLKHNPTFSYWF